MLQFNGRFDLTPYVRSQIYQFADANNIIVDKEDQNETPHIKVDSQINGWYDGPLGKRYNALHERFKNIFWEKYHEICDDYGLPKLHDIHNFKAIFKKNISDLLDTNVKLAEVEFRQHLDELGLEEGVDFTYTK